MIENLGANCSVVTNNKCLTCHCHKSYFSEGTTVFELVQGKSLLKILDQEMNKIEQKHVIEN